MRNLWNLRVVDPAQAKECLLHLQSSHWPRKVKKKGKGKGGKGKGKGGKGKGKGGKGKGKSKGCLGDCFFVVGASKELV